MKRFFADCRRAIAGLAIAIAVPLAPAGLAQAADKPAWSIEGVKLRAPATLPPPPIDVARIRRQQAQGCGDTGDIRFGDSALMRETVIAPQWPKDVRRLAAGAAITDDPALAYRLLRESLALVDRDDVASRVSLENMLLMTALQFRDFDQFHASRAAFGDSPLPGPLAADRMFMDAFARMRGAGGAADWAAIDALLERARGEDPLFFSVLVLRVVAWLKLAEATAPAACDAAARAFSDRLLDVTAAAVCPVLVAHVDHFIARAFSSQPLSGPVSGPGSGPVSGPVYPPARAGSQPPALALWRAFAMVVLSAATRNRDAYLAARQAVADHAGAPNAATACAGRAMAAIDAVEPR